MQGGKTLGGRYCNELFHAARAYLQMFQLSYKICYLIIIIVGNLRPSLCGQGRSLSA